MGQLLGGKSSAVSMSIIAVFLVDS